MGVTYVRVAVLRAAKYLSQCRFVSVMTYSLARHTVSRLSKSSKLETSVYYYYYYSNNDNNVRQTTQARRGIFWKLS